MLIVVDAHPGVSLVGGAEDAGLTLDGSGEVQRRINMSRSRLAESERMNFCNSRRTCKRDIFVVGGSLGCGVIKAVEGCKPEIVCVARRGAQTILTTAHITARRR